MRFLYQLILHNRLAEPPRIALALGRVGGTVVRVESEENLFRFQRGYLENIGQCVEPRFS